LQNQFWTKYVTGTTFFWLFCARASAQGEALAAERFLFFCFQKNQIFEKSNFERSKMKKSQNEKIQK